MTPDPGLLRACVEAPLDDAPRLVLADWLEEREWGDRMTLLIVRLDTPLGCWAIRKGELWRMVGADDLFKKLYPNGSVLAFSWFSEDRYWDDPDHGLIGVCFGKAPKPKPKCHWCNKSPRDLYVSPELRKWVCSDHIHGLFRPGPLSASFAG